MNKVGPDGGTRLMPLFLRTMLCCLSEKENFKENHNMKKALCMPSNHRTKVK